MSHPAAEAKVSNFIQEQLYPQFDNWLSDLVAGHLQEVEQGVIRLCGKLSDLLLSTLLPDAAHHCVEQHREKLVNVADRPLTVRLRSGCQVVVPSLYAKRRLQLKSVPSFQPKSVPPRHAL